MDISNRKIVFHIHTKYSSDSNSEPSEIVDKLAGLGINTAIITDHNTIKGAIEADEYAIKNYGDKFKVIIGEEVSTDAGDIIGFPLSEEIARGNYQAVINEIKKQKAFVCLPHPYKSHDLFLIHQEEFIEQFDFIEIFNSRLNKKLNDFAVKLNDKYRKIPIIGNDAHTIKDLRNCFLLYDEKMNIKESLTGQTPIRNFRKSQIINAKNNKSIKNFFKYLILLITNN